MDDKTKNLFEKAKSTAVVLGQKAAQVAGVAGEKAQEFFENTKASVAMHEIEKEIGDLYREIGKEIYLAQKDGNYTVNIDDTVAAIDLKKEELENLAAGMERKAQRLCPNADCRCVVSADDNFCPRCGAVLE